MKALIAAALLFGASQARANVSVEVATGDWGWIPQLQFRGDPLDGEVVGKVYELVQEGKCTIPGQSKRKLDMTVPFLVHYDEKGTLDRIVIEKIGCSEAEGVIGGAVLKLMNEGAYKPTGENLNGWYRSQLSFSYS